MRTLRNLSSILLLALLLWPSIVKLVHHPENLIFNNQSGIRLDAFHEKCIVCEFEFSVFTSSPGIVELLKIEHQDCYRLTYQSESFSCDSQFFFSLRAPPFYLV
jgi:hypothetical protein